MVIRIKVTFSTVFQDFQFRREKVVSHLAGCSCAIVAGNCGHHRHREHSILETQAIVKKKEKKFLKNNLLKMQTTSCSTCERHVTELRAVAENEKLCSKCRWRQEHKCPVKGCTMPASRVKLKNIPVRLVQTPEVVRGYIFAQFGMPVQLKQCCKVVLYQAP